MLQVYNIENFVFNFKNSNLFLYQVEGCEPNGDETLSLIPDIALDHLLPESHALEAGIVSWSPPQPNWNPWIGANIDEGMS